MSDVVYTFKRDKTSLGRWDINNPLRTDINGEQITLLSEIMTSLSRTCTMSCDKDICNIVFDSELTTSEVVQLESIVRSHKENM